MKHQLLALTTVFTVAFSVSVSAQKKPLDHSVYDSWQSIGENTISPDGRFVAYTVAVQEGDGKLYLQQKNGDTLAVINRGYGGSFLPGSLYFACKIKPAYAQTRKAKTEKKKEEDLPKDSLALIRLQPFSIRKIARVQSYKSSEKEGNLIAWLYDEAKPDREKPDSASRIRHLEAEADSLYKAADSLRQVLAEAKEHGMEALKPHRKPESKTIKPEGKTLRILDVASGDSLTVTNVLEYAVSKKGNKIAVVTGATPTDSLKKVLYVDGQHVHTVLEGFQAVRNLTFDREGSQLAFVADPDSGKSALRHFYRLYLFQDGKETASEVASRFSPGIPDSSQISENGRMEFSKSGKRLFFGTAPLLPLPDTSLPEFERVKLDIWHYKEDELHTVQLFNLDRDLKKSYTALYDLTQKKVTQLANDDFRRVYTTYDGDGKYFYTSTDTGRRVATQWMGQTPDDIYILDPVTGKKKLIAADFLGSMTPSYTSRYLLLYHTVTKQYSIYDSEKGTMKTIKIPTPLYDVENDVPADPRNYGVAGWSPSDDAVYVYDQYDIWKINTGSGTAQLAIPSGRKEKVSTRYVALDPELKYLPADSTLSFEQYHEQTKNNQYVLFTFKAPEKKQYLNSLGSYKYTTLSKADNADVFTFCKQNYQTSPNIWAEENGNTVQLSDINKQQSRYLWGTAELYKWKAYTGKETEGILYKPENFDPTKKYPLIAYFYERNNETLYNYQAPAPTPSRLNIPFFVSRGYLVFVPDVWYTSGHPGESAYNYIVSGVRSLVRKGYVDSTRMGIQGQSWGGYQTAYLITRVPGMFAAAWAGAPVVDMFSAYGGIRWQSGMNRQFQYEKTQSRIGATIWDKPQLYVENSPLFKLNKVKTPVVIMANDADGAVPWYQGIEMFTDLRRLGKPAWMLNYNGEAHNLVERKNRKDIQIREQQFFDWLLKGEKPAPWIEKGVPAVMKGRTMGLE